MSLAEILDPETLTPLTAAGSPDMNALPRAGIVTRWEGGKPKPAAVDAWIDLENGVQVWFEDGRFQGGDFWTIPARAVSGGLDWPADEFTGEPAVKAPEGPRRDYGALARLTKSNAGWTVKEDCRPIFPTAVKSLQVVGGGGDGQEALPDPLDPNARIDLPEALRVLVLRGHDPVAGETIRFEITDGDGRFGNGHSAQEAETDADGVAQVTWRLDAVTFSQSVAARRLDSADGPTHAPIVFNASLARADKTSFDPGGIAPLVGANTVQKAIEKLAGMQQIGCATHILDPGPGWELILEGLPAGSNASICFSPGHYTLARAVKLADLGHVSLHSAGTGTITIEIDRSESALEFARCTSVTVLELSVNTKAGASGIEPGLKRHRKGTLDFTGCGKVTVENLHGCLRCRDICRNVRV